MKRIAGWLQAAYLGGVPLSEAQRTVSDLWHSISNIRDYHTVRLPDPHHRLWWYDGPHVTLRRRKTAGSPVKPLLILRHEDDMTQDVLHRSFGWSGIVVGKYLDGAMSTDLTRAKDTVDWRNRLVTESMGPGCVIIIDNFDVWQLNATDDEKIQISTWCKSHHVLTHPTLVFIVKITDDNVTSSDEIRDRYDADVVYTRQSVSEGQRLRGQTTQDTAATSEEDAKASMATTTMVASKTSKSVCMRCLPRALPRRTKRFVFWACVFYWFYKRCPTLEFPRPPNYVQRTIPESELQQKVADLQPRRVAVVEGPPFCGKSFLVQHVTAELRVNTFTINCEGSEQEVEDVIRKLAKAAPEQQVTDVLSQFLNKAKFTEPAVVDPLKYADWQKSVWAEIANNWKWFTDYLQYGARGEANVTYFILENLNDTAAAKWVIPITRSSKHKVIITTQDCAALLSAGAVTKQDPTVTLGNMTEAQARELAYNTLRLWKCQTSLEPTFIDEVCRKYCDHRPSFVGAVFTAIARYTTHDFSASDTMEFIEDKITSIVAGSGPLREDFNQAGYVAMEDVHEARRKLLPAAQQAAYDDILGAMAAMGTTECPEEVLQCIREDHTDEVATRVIALMTNRWLVFRDGDSHEQRRSIHRLDLEGAKPKPFIAARALFAQLTSGETVPIDDSSDHEHIRQKWQRALADVMANSTAQEQRDIANLVRPIAARQPVVSLTFKTWKFRGYFASTLVQLARNDTIWAARNASFMACGAAIAGISSFSPFFRSAFVYIVRMLLWKWVCLPTVCALILLREELLNLQQDVSHIAEGADDEFLALLQDSDETLCRTAATEQLPHDSDRLAL
jgi:hypothetical protein